MDADLLAAIKRRDEAVQRRDGAAWGATATDRNINVVPNGVMRTREQRMTALSTEGGTFLPSQDEQFIVYGSTVLIYTYVQATGANLMRFVETWIKEASGWKLAVRQGTGM